MQTVPDILSSLGYTLKDNGSYWRAKPLYRESDNPTVLSIQKDTGKWYDFAANKGGTFPELVKITSEYLGLDIKVEDILKNVEIKNILKNKPRIKTPKFYDNEILKRLTQDHSYWVNRKIPLHIISQFHGGIATVGSLKDRYVFPVYDEYNRIVGFAGRDLKDLTNEERKKYGRMKWKLMFSTSDVIYPLSVDKNNSRAIIVESIGDFLSLVTAGYSNVFVLFGVKLHSRLINFLIKNDFQKIIVSTNNDSEDNGVGNRAAEEIKSKLLKFFDENQVEIVLPEKNDWNATEIDNIKRILK